MLNGVDYHRSMVLIAPGKGKIGVLTAFCDELIQRADERDPSLVPVYYVRSSRELISRPIFGPSS